jgi:hypothetical protein
MPVRDGEVVERGQQVRLEGIPQAQLRSGAPVEEGPHVEAVPTFRGGRQPEQLTRVEVVEDAPVGFRLRVVELVDDDDSVGAGRDVL